MTWLASLIALLAGALWRDCVLVASGSLLALNAFHAHMDHGAPWDGWRAAIHCWRAGALSILAAIALLGMAAGFLLEAWPAPSHDRGSATLVLALAVALAALAGDGLMAGGWRGHACAGATLVAAVAAEGAFVGGVAFAPCLFSIVVALVLARLGWRLAHDAAQASLRDSMRP